MHADSLGGKALRDRITNGAEDRLGRALSDLFDSSLLSSAIGKAFDAREKAAQAQEVAMGALNLPSAADVERLTRRLRSVSQRLEGIEDGVHRLDRTTSARLSSIEDELKQLAAKLESLGDAFARSPAASSSKPPNAASPARAGGEVGSDAVGSDAPKAASPARAGGKVGSDAPKKAASPARAGGKVGSDAPKKAASPARAGGKANSNAPNAAPSSAGAGAGAPAKPERTSRSTTSKRS